MTWISAGIAGAGLAIKGVSAYSQNRRAKKGLEALNEQPEAQYSVSPELKGAYDTALANSKTGHSPEEEAAFSQKMARSSATATRSALDAGGGNMASTINAGLMANEIGAINQFAASGAQLKQQKINTAADLARAIQSQENLGTGATIQKRMMLEQAYGGALAKSNENMQQAVGDAGELAMTGINAQRGRENDLAIAELYSKTGTNFKG